MKNINLQNIITVGAIIIAIAVWFFKVDNLPDQVANHEQRLIQLESNQVELKTKQELILKAVYEIRSVVMLKKEYKEN